MKTLFKIIIAIVLATTAQAERKLIGHKQGEGRFVSQPEGQAGDYVEAKAYAESEDSKTGKKKWTHEVLYKPCMRPLPGQKDPKMCQSTMGWMSYSDIVKFMDNRPQDKPAADKFFAAGVKNAYEMLRYCGGVWVKGKYWQEGERIPIYEEIPEEPVQFVQAAEPAPVTDQVNMHFYAKPQRPVVVEKPVYVNRPVVQQQRRCCVEPEHRHGCKHYQGGGHHASGFQQWMRRMPWDGINSTVYRQPPQHHQPQQRTSGSRNTATAKSSSGNQTFVRNDNLQETHVVIKGLPQGMPQPKVTQRRQR